MRLHIGLIVCLCFVKVYAASFQLFPGEGFLYPRSFEGIGENRQVASAFQNPSTGFTSKKNQFLIENINDYFDYNQLSMAYILPFSRFSLSFSYLEFASNDIRRNVIGANTRPEFQSYFSDTHKRIRSAVTFSLIDNLRFSGIYSFYSHKLDKDQANLDSFDFGLNYQLNEAIFFEFYTSNLIHSKFLWQNTGIVDDVKPLFYSSFRYLEEYYQLLLSTNQLETLIRGEYRFDRSLSIFSDLVLTDFDSFQRYSYGVIFALPMISFQYTHLSFLHEALSRELDMFAFHFSWDMDVEQFLINEFDTN